MKFYKPKYVHFFGSILALFLCSCRTNLNFLQKNEFLIYDQKITGLKTIRKENLQVFFKQKPNKKFISKELRPYLFFYVLGSKFYNRDKYIAKAEKINLKYDAKIKKEEDSVKVEKLKIKKEEKIAKNNIRLDKGNWLMRTVGEPPVKYDTNLSLVSLNQMSLYLNSNGFFHHKIEIKTFKKGKFKSIHYQISEGIPHILTRINFDIEDKNIKKIVRNEQKNTKIITDERYNEKKIVEERDRLEKIIKDQGYYDFSKQFIFFEPDTSIPFEVKLNVIIKNPIGLDSHLVYKIDSVIYNFDKPLNTNTTPINQKKFNNNNFNYYLKNYDARIVNFKNKIKIGDKYSFSKTFQTQRNLSKMSVFKFSSVTYRKSNDTSQSLITSINLNSQEKYNFATELGAGVSQNLPGPFGNVSLQSQNLFKSCETFDFGIRGTIEGVANATSQGGLYQSKEISANTNLTFPIFYLPLIFNEKFKDNNPQTKLSAGYSLILRPEYNRSNTRVQLTYSFQKSIYDQFTFTPIDINYILTPRLDENFRNTLLNLYNINRNPLYLSFQTSFYTGINLAYTFNDYIIGVNKKAKYFRIYAESGGSIYNLVSENKTTQLLSNLNYKPQLFQFWKVSMDYRKYYPLNKSTCLAMRIFAGVSNPYGIDNAIPYEKYFFSGGSNSIRAWAPRRLGLGGVIPTKNPNGSLPFEQPGEMIFEYNIEYRFDIFKYLEGAFFTDVGNVWLYKNRNQNPNQDAYFSKNAFKQLAVGSGFGIRLDFTFFLIRLDIATKIWDPGQINGNHLIANKITWRKPIGEKGQTLFNIGIGYPF